MSFSLLIILLTENSARAWPCRLLHDKGQCQPFLTLDPKWFKSCIEELQRRAYGKTIMGHLSTKDIGREVESTDVPGMTSHNIQVTEIKQNFMKLHERTKCNLLRVEDPNFVLPRMPRAKMLPIW